MFTGSISDLASAIALTRIGKSTRSSMADAAAEVASGRKSDLQKATGGNLAPLFSIERALVRLETRSGAIDAASAKATAAQLYLGKIQSEVAQYGVDLIAAVDLESRTQAFSVAASARGAFDAIVSAINGRYGGQALFAGAAVGGAALIDAKTMYADITALTAAAPDAISTIAAVDAYFFDSAGGFATSGFIGDLANAPGAEIAAGEVVDYSVRGDNAALRSALRNTVLAAIAANRDHGGTDLDGMVILRAAGTGAVANANDLIGVRARLGQVEERLESTRAFNAAQTNVFELKRDSITAADPYQSATRLQSLQGQIEAVYLLTARLSGLRLQNYLR